MTRLKSTLMAAALAGGLAIAGTAAAEHMGGWHHGEAMEILHGLNLTDAQQKQVDQIVSAAHQQARPAWEQLRALHKQMAAKLLTAGTTEADLLPIVQQEEGLRNKLDAEHVSVAVQIRNVLTPAQLSEAAAKHAKLEALHAAEDKVMGGDH